MVKMVRPAVPEVPVPVLPDAYLKNLLAAHEGGTFEDRRPSAIVRLLADTGMRRAELLGMGLADLNRDLQVAVVVEKGFRPRSCPCGIQTGPAQLRSPGALGSEAQRST